MSDQPAEEPHSPRSSARRVALLTNVLAPYRVPIFQRLAEQYDVTVVLSGEEANRDIWREVDRQTHGYTVHRSKGMTFAWTKRNEVTALDTRYLHLNPGLFADLRRIRPDAIVSDEMGFRTLVAMAYGRLYRRPVWVWWGGTLHTERAINPPRRHLRRWLAPAVRRWFSYGVTSTEYLASLGVPPERVVELQNCIPEARYRSPVAPAFAIAPRPVLLCVSRLVPGKGIDLLLRAAARLQAEGLTFSLLVVGDGPERAALEQLTSHLGLRNTHFRGALPPSEVPAIHRSGDVLVFPTLDDVWGLVVNEALWSGVPALVSVYAGCARELVPEASTFDPLDPVSFTDMLRRAVSGALPPPDVARLRRLDDVSDTLARDLDATLRSR